MTRFIFNLPDIGEGIVEAEIVGWHVKPGDMIEEDGQIADVMTDKATVEMESPVSGKIIEIAGDVGDVIAIGSMLVVIEIEGEVAGGGDTGAEVGAAVEAAAQAIESEAAREGAKSLSSQDQAPSPARIQPAPAVQLPKSTGHINGGNGGAVKVLASPAVRRRAKDLGVDLGEIKPAAQGRIRHADLDAFLLYNGAQGFGPIGAGRADETIKIVGLRRRIAENMQAAKRHIPHFTYVEECDVTELERMRAQLNEGRSRDDGARPKLTMMPLLIAAICKVVPQFPMINAHYDDEANIVTRRGAVHLGMATQTQGGLMVPVIRDAHKRNIWQLAREIRRLADAARGQNIKPADLSGSTLTLTSLGPLGGVATTPIINRPEVAIIGPNRIVERPMFVPDGVGPNGMGGERIEKRKLMNISISCDHRVVDGYDAARFIQEVKKLIETPAMLLAD